MEMPPIFRVMSGGKNNDRREYRAEWYRERYANDPEFREAERRRRREWIENKDGREKVRQQVAEWRARKRAEAARRRRRGAA